MQIFKKNFHQIKDSNLQIFFSTLAIQIKSQITQKKLFKNLAKNRKISTLW